MLNLTQISNIVEKIKSGKYSEKELNNFYENAKKEASYHQILEASFSQLCTDYPTSKIVKIHVKNQKVKLENSIKHIMQTNHWDQLTDNIADVRVVTGGRIIDGTAFANYYFRYKQEGWKRSMYFSITQQTSTSQPFFNIKLIDEAEEHIFQSLVEAENFFNAQLKLKNAK